MVKTAPATITPDEAPMDWMITFCPSAFFLRNAADAPTAMMEMGMAASKTWPIFSPE